MGSARRLIERVIEDPQSAAGNPNTKGVELYDGDDRCVYGFTTLADRSEFVQNAEAAGQETDEVDADAYAGMVPDTYPFLAIVWK